MNVLILGSGGREQALAWKISQSPLVTKTYIAPGNAGRLPGCENIEVSLSDFPAVVEVIRNHTIDMVVIGPEVPLVEGITDYLSEQKGFEQLHIIGPSKAGAMLEGSKDFAKDFMMRHKIPTAKHRTFTSATLEKAKSYLRDEERAPYVLKADGLAAGKGVLIIDNYEEACAAMEDMLGGKFGNAGNRVVVETFLSGIECSLFVLTDGHDYKLLPMAKDYKRIGEGDTGLNTGGMGAVSPVPFADEAFVAKVEERIVRPTIKGIESEGIDYKGFVFIGLINCQGDPYVIEYNCRMGDPETEAVMLRIKGDLVPALLSLKDGNLKSQQLCEKDNHVATVVAVSGGYPEDFQKGFEIMGLGADTEDSVVFHAGTKSDEAGKQYTSGGRVVASSAIGKTLEEALAKSYARLSAIKYEGIYYRRDIGQDML
ncbi:phosphoribosylamine--glycine ligase [Porphyromonas sp.]|uniref:phosphoribosylamine--glycine ligase n=1 Tax=Porphyromonas sp. TaxID=1924944 RepID=UPI0026DAC375|nr:phosphoribosylamine--glycine ligase [Porphyromonas sp.]MDO4770771.1 phosphoribosylamine--glycine ligase [Porphyromonas sp.]